MYKMCSLLLNLKNNNNHNNDLSELKRVPDIQFPYFSYVLFFHFGNSILYSVVSKYKL